MEIHDSINGKAPAAHPADTPARGISLDRLELKREWTQQTEERQVEEALDLYAKAARQRMQSDAPQVPASAKTEEERQAESQQLRLRQKCQDIAALKMVEELAEGLDGEEE